ncbi:oligopeptide/dipeptide transporter [Microbacterium sp. SLBN-154]|uniref:ABC transporter ATP-binding protein n=1 Tax=Microbacterium sp. SLBN-154 TaxID=2768458 RepID=UPI00114F3A26|nr:ATP-binding cassette domain-containing protein [Microbacterium sp. SLBN-154]TQK17585.1 oligopeptide/dipeptide transporter [Microbacterium sp. SLBN-154]
MRNAEVLVEAINVGKEFRRGGSRVRAVSDVSFQLHAGESLAIVGESGSGKSTVARMVMGMTEPSSGTISLGGGAIPSRGRSTRLRRQRAGFVQMVFQDPYSSLDPRQKISDCLAEALSVHSGLERTEREARVRELLDQVSLDPSLAASYPRALSGGQRQRVAIARALAADPRVLVLDEAVSALDVSVQAKVLRLLESIRTARGMSYIFISHDLGVVREISNSVLVMKQGEVVESGATAEVLDAPQHPYTQLLRACVPRAGWRPEDALVAIERYRSAP